MSKEFQVEIGQGVRYTIHSLPRRDNRRETTIVSRVLLPEQAGVVTVYANGDVVIENNRSGIEYNYKTGALSTLG